MKKIFALALLIHFSNCGTPQAPKAQDKETFATHATINLFIEMYAKHLNSRSVKKNRAVCKTEADLFNAAYREYPDLVCCLHAEVREGQRGRLIDIMDFLICNLYATSAEDVNKLANKAEATKMECLFLKTSILMLKKTNVDKAQLCETYKAIMCKEMREIGGLITAQKENLTPEVLLLLEVYKVHDPEMVGLIEKMQKLIDDRKAGHLAPEASEQEIQAIEKDLKTLIETECSQLVNET